MPSLLCGLCRDSSNESGQAETVSLSMSVSELDEPEVKGKKKRGRPGRPPVRQACNTGASSQGLPLITCSVNTVVLHRTLHYS